jgi:hypothetical protein
LDRRRDDLSLWRHFPSPTIEQELAGLGNIAEIGRALVAALCALASRGEHIAKADDAADGCHIEAAKLEPGDRPYSASDLPKPDLKSGHINSV